MKYCSKKYVNSLSEKFAKVLNNNTNGIKIAFKKNKGLINTINDGIKGFTITPHHNIYNNSGN